MKNNSSLLNIFKKHRAFLITTHVSPDADAVSSALALALVLKSMGKRVTVVNEDRVPDWLGFLPGTRLFKKADALKNVDYDVAVALDCGDLARIGRVKSLLKANKPLVNIDHHKTNTQFGQVNYVQPLSSSTAEVLYELFNELKVDFTKDLATLLYVGIMTDTGSFRYDCTTGQTHRIIARLMDFKISPADLYKKIYDNVPFCDLKLFLAIAGKVSFMHQGKIVCLEMNKRLLSKFSDGFDARDKLFSLFRSVNGVEVIVIFNEMSGKQTRVNFRSKGRFDVARLAQSMGGGGHAKASGCTLDMGMHKARTLVLNEIIKGM